MAPLILYPGTRWRWVVIFMSWLLFGARSCSSHWIQGWEGPRPGLDALEKILLTLLGI